MPYKEKKVEKLFYSIGEVAKILDVPVSTVRFWENEFDILKPRRNRKGNRLFTPDDLANIRKVYYLLKEKGMTIEGAKKTMAEKWDETENVIEVTGRLKEIRAMLVELVGSF